MRRPRVLYASFDAVPAPKGAAEHIARVAEALTAVAEVDLMTLRGDGAPPLPAGARHLPVAPREGNFLQRALEWGDAVARQILAERYAVVHVRSVWEGLPALVLQAERGYLLVYEANGLPSVELKYHYPALATARELTTRLRRQEQALLAAAGAVITQSHTSRKYLCARGASSARVRVIPNGADPERFASVPALAPPEGEAVVLYLGTLAPWQGLPFLVEAMALAAAAREPESAPRLRIVGSGRREWRRDLERQARRLRVGDRVDILPAVPPDEVPALLGRAHLCAAPLAVTDRNVVQGCCPLKIVEYMMAGRPIVAPRLEPVREMLAHERTALLYKPDKPRRLADAILRLLDDPGLAGRLGANAAEDARQRFTWRRHNDAVAALYRELLASGDG